MRPDGVSVRLLGPLEVERGGAPIPLGGHAQRALLARLLLEATAGRIDRVRTSGARRRRPAR